MLKDVLNEQGKKGVDLIKESVSKYSATGKTADSIEYKSDDKRLQILAREFIQAMETGRGPRKSSDNGNFKDRMLEYMERKGIGSSLDQKKKEALAKFLVLKINREGDKLYKSGTTRNVYSKVLSEFVEQLEKEVSKAQLKQYTDKVLESLNAIK